jgi:hypothetical protein
MPAGSSFTLRRVPLFALVMGVGLMIGFLVPVVYELTEKPWNRMRLPGMEQAAMLSAAVACGLGVLEYWHLKRFGTAADERPRKVQFRLWQLFAVMTLAAVVLAVVKWLGIAWGSALVAVVVLGVLSWGLFQEPRVQLRAAALVAGMFCPLVWMIAYNVPIGRTSGLVSAIAFAPAILPAVLIRAVTNSGGPDQMGMVAGVIVIAELLLGAWFAWRGGKSFVGYLLLVLVVSSVSSFGMHALYRA